MSRSWGLRRRPRQLRDPPDRHRRDDHHRGRQRQLRLLRRRRPRHPGQLELPLGVSVDLSGNLLIADFVNFRIRRVNATTGVITTVAGDGNYRYSGDGGAATAASLSLPGGVASDAQGNLYIADSDNAVVRRVDAASGIITTVAGQAGLIGFGGDGGPATAAQLYFPTRVAVDLFDNVLIADFGNGRVRRVDASSGVITTIAGGGLDTSDVAAALSANLGAVTDTGILYIASEFKISMLDGGVVTRIAGNGSPGYAGDGGDAAAALVNGVGGLALNGAGDLLIGDTNNNGIRAIVADVVQPYDAIVSLATQQSFLDILDAVQGNLVMISIAGRPFLALPVLTGVGGDVVVLNNPDIEVLDAPQLETVVGALNVSGNSLVTVINLPALTEVGGNLALDGNVSMTQVSLPGLVGVGGNLVIVGSSPTVTLTALQGVGGSFTLEAGNGTLDLAKVMVWGNLDVTGLGTEVVSANTAGGDTSVTLVNAEASMTALLPLGTFGAPVAFTIEHLATTTLVPEDGQDGSGAAALVDPVAAYRFNFAIPSLGEDATLTFDVDVLALAPSSRDALLAALGDGLATLAVKGDAPGSEYQAFNVCSGAQTPAVDGCVGIVRFDAAGNVVGPDVTPALVRFVGVVGHFSTYAVVVVTPEITVPGECHVLAHWPFDEVSNNVSLDAMNGHAATYIGNASEVDGFLGKGVKLTKDGLVRIQNLVGALPSFTVSIWVRLEDRQRHVIVTREKGCTDCDDDRRIWLQHSPGKKKGYTSRIGATPVFAKVRAHTNHWEHLAVTYTSTPSQADASECGVAVPSASGLVKIYVDGVLAKCGARTEESFTGDFLLGALHRRGNPKKGDFKGRFDELAIFDTALPTSTITSIAAGAASSADMRDVVRAAGGCAPWAGFGDLVPASGTLPADASEPALLPPRALGRGCELRRPGQARGAAALGARSDRRRAARARGRAARGDRSVRGRRRPDG